jgi:hypothetical protein
MYCILYCEGKEARENCDIPTTSHEAINTKIATNELPRVSCNWGKCGNCRLTCYNPNLMISMAFPNGVV